MDLNNISEGFGYVIAAIIGIVPVLLAWFTSHKEKKKQLEMAQAELDFQRYSLDFGQFLDEWESTHNEILHLLETTNIDRFLILRAWNGENNPQWTTSVLQIRQGEQEPISYIHFELDGDYIERIKALKVNNHNYYIVDDLPDYAILKEVYKAEGITSILWSLIGVSEVIDGRQAVTYCSFASHEDKPLSEEEITKAKILVGRLKGIQNLFVEKQRTK